MKLKQYLLASAVCVLPFAASAADLPVKAPYKVAAVAPFTWTGFYVGGSGGLIFQGAMQTDLDGDPYLGGVVGGTHSVNSTGGILGINAGYNYQMGTWVLGIEADIAASILDDTNFANNLSVFGGACRWGFQSKLSSLGTVRGRIGYAFDRALIYGTGGWAYGRVENSATNLTTNTPGKNFYATGMKSGWVAGGGVEYAVTNTWTVRAEALYVNLGTNTVKANNSGCTFGFKNTYTIGRLGLNYKF